MKNIKQKDLPPPRVIFPSGMLEFTCLINGSLRTFRTDARRMRDAKRDAVAFFNSERSR